MKKLQKIEDNIIQDVRNLFRLKIEIDDTKIKDIKNLSRMNQNKAFKERLITDVMNLFEHEEEEDYCSPIRVVNIWNDSYVEL